RRSGARRPALGPAIVVGQRQPGVGGDATPESDAVSTRSRRGGEDGIALLIVLLTITLLTIIVVEFTQSAEVEMHFAISSRNALQAFYLARSGINVGEALLAADAKINKNDSDEDIWAVPMPPLPVGDGTVALRIQDEGRRLNLNGLSGN